MKQGVLLALLAGALRLINLGGEALWYDETFTAWLARLDLPSMFSAIRGDVHPILWYLIEWLTTRLFGQSEIALRLPAAILSIISVLLLWRVALALGMDRRTAFVAGLLAAILPMGIYYGQEARMYALLSCCVLLMLWGALREHWLVFSLAGTAAVYTQNLALIYVGCIGLGILVGRWGQWREMLRPLLALGAIAASWLVWMPTFLYQSSQVQQGFWIQPLTLGSWLFPLPSMTMGMRLPESLQMHVYAVAIGLTIIGLIVGRQWLLSKNGMLVVSVVIGVPLALGLISILWRSIYLPRALLPSAMGLLLIWAYCLLHLSPLNRRIAWAVTVPMLGVAVIAHYAPASARPDTAAWLAPVERGWQQGDVVYYISIDTAILYQHYLGRDYALFPEATDLNQSLTPETKRAMGMIERPFDTLASSYRRAWVMATSNPLTSTDEVAEINRLIGTYPSVLIASQGNEYQSQKIYLVTLWK